MILFTVIIGAIIAIIYGLILLLPYKKKNKAGHTCGYHRILFCGNSFLLFSLFAYIFKNNFNFEPIWQALTSLLLTVIIHYMVIKA